jgi:hypothetical protein
MDAQGVKGPDDDESTPTCFGIRKHCKTFIAVCFCSVGVGSLTVAVKPKHEAAN